MEEFQNKLNNLAEKYGVKGVLLVFCGDRKPIIVGDIPPLEVVKELFKQVQSQNIFTDPKLETELKKVIGE